MFDTESEVESSGLSLKFLSSEETSSIWFAY